MFQDNFAYMFSRGQNCKKKSSTADGQQRMPCDGKRLHDPLWSWEIEIPHVGENVALS